jgi:hypothetical protein
VTTFLLVVAAVIGGVLLVRAFRGFPTVSSSTSEGLEAGQERLRRARLAVAAAILPVPFWLAHWIGTGHWLPGLLVVGFLSLSALVMAVIYALYGDGVFQDVFDLRRREPLFNEIRARYSPPPSPEGRRHGWPSTPVASVYRGPTTAPGFAREELDEPVLLMSWSTPDLHAQLSALSPIADRGQRLAVADSVARALRAMGNALVRPTPPGAARVESCTSRRCRAGTSSIAPSSCR